MACQFLFLKILIFFFFLIHWEGPGRAQDSSKHKRSLLPQRQTASCKNGSTVYFYSTTSTASLNIAASRRASAPNISQFPHKWLQTKATAYALQDELLAFRKHILLALSEMHHHWTISLCQGLLLYFLLCNSSPQMFGAVHTGISEFVDYFYFLFFWKCKLWGRFEIKRGIFIGHLTFVNF